ncbi:hypothetical protein DYI41_04840 [Marinobacter salarius]|uniref:hypothetical protein n=1 Tax=Marinobacter salarius TaxID=1420917 RepID=UPI001BCD69CE|nr:hypothetical protein [Marinobacter salarius]MBS8230256.1 hypothetical protein [Marinobacter salarius]
MGLATFFRESEEAVPQIVETTDEIGVREQRDILFLSFNQISEPTPLSDESWKNIPYRSMILQWLEANEFAWEMCIHCSPGTIVTSYKGDIYIDLPPDPQCQRYQRLLEFLEDEEENCRFPGVSFWRMPLSLSQTLYDQRQALADQ